MSIWLRMLFNRLQLKLNHTHTHTHTHTGAYTYAHRRTRAHTYTYAHARTHTHVQYAGCRIFCISCREASISPTLKEGMRQKYIWSWCSTSSSPLLPGPLSPSVLVSIAVLSMVQIDLFKNNSYLIGSCANNPPKKQLHE